MRRAGISLFDEIFGAGNEVFPRIWLGLSLASEVPFFALARSDAEQFKAILAAEIIKALDREGLSAAPRRVEPVSLQQIFPAFETPISVGSQSTA